MGLGIRTAWRTFISDVAPRSALLSPRHRIKLLRRAGYGVGEGTFILPGSVFDGLPITIGNDSWIGPGCQFRGGRDHDWGPRGAGSRSHDLHLDPRHVGPRQATGRGLHQAGPD